MIPVAEAFLTAFCLAFLVFPTIIKIARNKQLCDQPNHRSSHRKSTPSLGGLGVFFGLTISVFFWSEAVTPLLQYLLCAVMLITAVGLNDDIQTMQPLRKLVVQAVAILLVIYFGELRIHSLHGFFGITELPVAISYGFTLLFMLTVINGFNLIDGINGLAGSVALISGVVFGAWFYANGVADAALVAVALSGAALAFLFFNVTPAKIFLGDTGSLLIGLLLAVLGVQLLEAPLATMLAPANTPAMLLAMLILPLFDTCRVFILRLYRGQSPFLPDRNHLHHLLIDMGYSHMRAAGLLVMANVLMLVVAILLQPLAIEWQLLSLFILATAGSLLLDRQYQQMIKSVSIGSDTLTDNELSPSEAASKTAEVIEHQS
ncbi:MAG: MraY family glycosyltransferase [Bacteroidota bacterium]